MPSNGTDTALPLSGLVVLDLTVARAGPTCVRHLGDWGADIIRVEPPPTGGEAIIGDRNGFDYQNLHRNKRIIQLNLKSPEGREAFMRLVEKADVVIENMRTSVKHRLKVAWEDVQKVNPRIVYGSISGFGQTGPYSHRGGVDQIAQGMGGLMSITGLPGQGPVRAGVAISDLTAGSLLAFGIMMALYERMRTGKGRWIHTSLLESQIFLLDFQATRWLIDGEVAGQAGNDHPVSIPMGVFPASDGMINLAASSARLWERFCDIVERPDWKTKPGWETLQSRAKNRKEINAAIAEVTKLKPVAYWVETLDDAGIPCGPINSIDQVFSDPQVQHLGMAAPVHHPQLGDIKLVNSALNVEGVTRAIHRPTPEPGGDTLPVLKSIGYSEAEIEALRAKGAI